MSYPCPSPGHTYDFSLGSGAIILQSSLRSSRWHHLTACSTGSRGHAFLQHAMRSILQQQKQACKAHRPAKKDGVLCRRMRSLRERLCKHAQANEHAACRKAWHVQGNIAYKTQTRRPAQTCCFAKTKPAQPLHPAPKTCEFKHTIMHRHLYEPMRLHAWACQSPCTGRYASACNCGTRLLQLAKSVAATTGYTCILTPSSLDPIGLDSR